jgi:NAD(P)-dependent dehydrogenase (short-subunit alcohol dehydrogenase family)
VRKTSNDDWDRVIHVNLSGAFYLIRHHRSGDLQAAIPVYQRAIATGHPDFQPTSANNLGRCPAARPPRADTGRLSDRGWLGRSEAGGLRE